MGPSLSTDRPRIMSFLESETIALEGADSVKVYVHKELLDAHCKASGECWWSCFNSHTLKRLVEYLYQGDCTGALPVPALLATPASTIYGGDSDSRGSETDGESTPLATNIPTSPESLDYEGVLVSHAELFILAKSVEIVPLGTMCLTKLLEDIEQAQVKLPNSIFSENMVELLRYSYSQCYMRDSPAWEELQEITSNIWVAKIEWILETPGSSLLDGEGKMVKDLMIGTVRRLIEADNRLASKEDKKPTATPQDEPKAETDNKKNPEPRPPWPPAADYQGWSTLWKPVVPTSGHQ